MVDTAVKIEALIDEPPIFYSNQEIVMETLQKHFNRIGAEVIITNNTRQGNIK